MLQVAREEGQFRSGARTLAYVVWVAFAASALSAVAGPTPAVPTEQMRVVAANGGLHLEKSGSAHTTVAIGKFEDGLFRDGWGILNIQTNHMFPDEQQAYAAGMIEGFLTAGHIYATQRNLYAVAFGENVTDYNHVDPEVVEWLDRQEAWTRGMIAKQSKTDLFWAQVGNVMAQFDGLIHGYSSAVDKGMAPKIERFSFTLLSSVGDLFDIVPTVKKQERLDWFSLPAQVAELMHSTRGHCSAIIKLLPDFSDLYMAHSSWFSYSNTNRIYKHYFFNFSNPSTAARLVSFSSYPGYLFSLDDFYLMDSGLGMTQTTNTVLDQSVYDEVKPESLLAWQRVRVANVMARTGYDWKELLTRHFSGTYANQYMVIDFKLFEPNKPVKAGLLWVVEEMPGLVVGGDRSETLARGYWPSYNVPFWPEVFRKSGYPHMASKHGNYFTYELCPRAQIFRRDEATVRSMRTLKSFMRYNDYLNDPLSLDSSGNPNPTYAICARNDLLASNASAVGCYDTKVTSYTFGAMQQHVEAVNGPSLSEAHGNLPPFSWKNPKFVNGPNTGLPSTYVFDFIDVRPSSPLVSFGSDEERRPDVFIM